MNNVDSVIVDDGYYSTSSIPSLNNTSMSGEINEIATVLSKAQAELEAVGKGEKGYGYNYASLTSTIEVAKPILAKHNLAITQLVGNEGNNPSITTILMHSSGQFIKSTASLPLVEMKGCNEAQRAGAVYSYLRRYALQAILNMSSEDTDASSNGPVKTKTSFSKKATSKPTDAPRAKFRRKRVENTDDDI